MIMQKSLCCKTGTFLYLIVFLSMYVGVSLFFRTFFAKLRTVISFFASVIF